MSVPIAAPPLLYLDRYRNEGTRTYSRHAGYTEAEERYRPTSTQETFDLDAAEMPTDRMNVYTANPPSGLSARYLRNEKVLFLTHPQVTVRCADDPYVTRTRELGTACDPVPASPTSSTRTLLVHEGDPAHAVKVHFPFRVSRYQRRMRDEVVHQAVNVSKELEEAVPDLDGDFAFLREVIGVTHQDLEPGSARGENWGFLVREMEPYPRRGRTGHLVPGFALYGKDLFDPGARPLLFDLIAARDRVGVVLEKVLFPIIRHWVSAFLRLGYILEPHGQNVLLELGPDGDIARIVHRDLSVGIDMRRRRDVGLPDGDLNAYNRMQTGDFASIAYDKFMGGHFFQRVVETLHDDDDGVRAEDLQGACREEFTRLFPEYRSYLPKTVRYFSEKRDQFGKPLFQDTGQAPVWR
jgi:hypothetical protein